ncbi:MAG: hypothetical protein EU548_10235, partial [Promethearchaeota archaeon]
MKKIHILILCGFMGIMIFEFFSSITPLTSTDTDLPQPSQLYENNQDIIDEILQSKLNQHDNVGQFTQFYGPSLRATYYGLFILDAIDRIEIINSSEMTQFIMDQYENTSNTFGDTYSQRFLDTDFDQTYYPLHTLLETNIYALLSLDILGELGRVNKSVFREFIWSCYNPEEHGF